MDENKSYGFGTENQQGTAQPDTFGTPAGEQSFGTPSEEQGYGAQPDASGTPAGGQSFGTPADGQAYGAPAGEQGYGAQPDGQTYGQPNGQFGGQTYGQPADQFGGQAYGQPNGQFGGQAYGQPNDQFGGQAYGQPNGQFGGQTYGQPNDQFGGQTYGQPADQFGGQAYGQTNYGMGAMPMDANGQPLKNTFGMKMTFSILEIICCCCCNIVTMVLGIIACVFTTKANNAYKSGNAQEYKSNSKTASICLWIGLGFAVIWLIICIAVGNSDYGKEIEDAFWAGYYGVDDYDTDTDDFSDDDDYDYDYDYDYDDDSEDSEDVADSGDTADSEDADDAEPLDITPGEGFDDPAVTVNGVEVAFPLDYSEFKALGFYIEEEDENYVANGSEYYYPDFYDASGNELGYVYIGNVTDSPIALKDGVVFGFWFTSIEYNDELTLEFSNGLTLDATREDFLKAYGDPDYSYESDSNDYQSYQWYNHSDIWEDMEENSLSVDFWDGEVDEIDLMYIGWD